MSKYIDIIFSYRPISRWYYDGWRQGSKGEEEIKTIILTEQKTSGTTIEE